MLVKVAQSLTAGGETGQAFPWYHMPLYGCIGMVALIALKKLPFLAAFLLVKARLQGSSHFLLLSCC